MASLPPQSSPLQRQQSSSQQRASSPSAPETSSSQHRRSSIPQSATSEDSQTVLLNHPSSSESSPKPEPQQKQVSPRPKARTAPSNTEPRKCWICFADETEDSPTSSEWRSPCPCALTAHESCLLDWVADLEAPNRKRTGPPKIECPQCKAKITIARPRSLVVEGVQAVERASGRLLLPFILVTLAGTVITGCWLHGFSTVYLLFGPEDAERLLGRDSPNGINNNWGLGLPFIPIVLVAARTTHADNLLPILPIFYFASSVPRQSSALWPPSAAMTVASLPYLRGAYNEIYRRFFAPKEQAWLKEIQPRAGDHGEGEEQDRNNEAANDQADDAMNFQLDLEVDIIEEEEEVIENQQHQDQPAGNAQPAGQAGANEDQNRDRDQNQNQNQNQPQDLHHPFPHPHQQPPGEIPGNILGNRQEARGAIALDLKRIPETIIGALIFPSISAAMGALLQVALPKTWTTPPSRWDRYPIGFLQSRFGRSVVGGCLFVVLKDTLLLYSKYRLAQDHKKRSIVDYAAKKKKRAEASRDRT